MDRRRFIASFALSGLALPRAGTAQSRKVYRIGVLSLRPTADLAGPDPRSPSIKALLQGLRELGYVYGEHFVTEVRGGEGRPERFPSLAAELLAQKVDVVVASGPALPALKQTGSSIPVIMTATFDPVSQGFVQSLARPGGNFTGFSLQSIETVGKRLELLAEIVPGTAPVAVIWEPAGLAYWQAAEAAARARGMRLLSLEIRNLHDVESAFKTASSARAAGVVVLGAAGLLFPNARRVAELALKHRLPSMFELREFVEAGGLVSYGPDINDIWRRAAALVDKIVKGAKPASLPIEQPTKFELLVNLLTAQALGLTIPQTILLRTDEVIP